MFYIRSYFSQILENYQVIFSDQHLIGKVKKVNFNKIKNSMPVMESFYIEPGNIKNGFGKVVGDEFFHLVRVSRKRKGELIYLFDGTGKIYTARIVDIGRDKAECEIISEDFMRGEVDENVAIAQAILKNLERFEFALEKLTELGVKHIIPLITERVVPAKSPKDISRNKIERWKKIILSACKQSNRALIPELSEPISFESFILTSEMYEKKIILHEGANFKSSLFYDYIGQLGDISSILIAVGPEGGFTDEEVELAVKSGFDVVSLGERRSR